MFLIHGADQIPRERQIAAELDVAAPNARQRIVSGAVGGAALGGAFELAGRGLRYLAAHQANRNVGQPADVDEYEHRANVAEASARLRDEIPIRDRVAPDPQPAPLSFGQFDFSRTGNASPETNRVGYVFGRLLELGYEPHVAAGLVGNIMTESGSGINTRAVGDNGNAFGMGQWNGPRRRAYLAFARSRGVDPGDIDTQIAWLDLEMRTTEATAAAKIRAAGNAQEAAAIAGWA